MALYNLNKQRAISCFLLMNRRTSRLFLYITKGYLKMKKTILGLAVSAMFMAGTVQAETNANDVSATLSITGSVTPAEFSCAVQLSTNTINMVVDTDKLVPQGQNGLAEGNNESLFISVAGDDQCAVLAGEGKIAYKFVGTADNADGTVIANSATGDNAAAGVGIGLYDDAGNVIKINDDTVVAKTTKNMLVLSAVKLNGQTVTTGNLSGSVTIQIERL
ncbi:fimbrial protein [Cronobacter dublinensis]